MDTPCEFAGCPACSKWSVTLRSGARVEVCEAHHSAIMFTIGSQVQTAIEVETEWEGDEDNLPTRIRPSVPIARPADVYFVRRGDGLVKIGQSTNVAGRVRDLSTAAGPMELLCTEPGGLARERELHEIFAEDRVHGEWFKESDQLTAYLSKDGE